MELNDQVKYGAAQSQRCVHLDVTLSNDSVHGHPKQVDHHLSEVILLDGDYSGNSLIDFILDLDSFLYGVIMSDFA